MRSLLVLLTFLLLTGSAMAADSQNPAAQADAGAQPATPAAIPPAKIGVVDMQAILMESEPAKVAKQELEKKYGKEQEALKKRGADLKKQADGLKNPKTSEEKRLNFIKSKQKLDNDTRTFLRKAEQDEMKLRQDVVLLIYDAAYNVAHAQGFTFVVDVNGGGVLNADPSMNLTPAVMAEVNRLYKERKDKKPDTPPAAQPENKTQKK